MLMALALGLRAAILTVVRGGSIDGLAATRLRWTWLLALGLAVQLGAQLWSPSWLDGSLALLVLVLSNLAVVTFIAGNRRLPGLLLADVGIALNVVVIVANGAMPVSADAARLAGVAGMPANAALKHEPMNGATALPWLADVIPEPGLREVLSVGDVLLAAGIARLVYARSMTRARHRPRHRAGAPRGTRATPASG